MFDKLTLATGVFALQQGWNLFDNVANPSHGGSGSSRTYHK